MQSRASIVPASGYSPTLGTSAAPWSAVHALAVLPPAATELTIASGAVAITQGVHTVDTEADASSDALTTITGGTAGQVLQIRPASAARTVILTHGIGSNLIACPGGVDLSLAEATDAATLVYNGTQWVVLSVSTLAAAPYLGAADTQVLATVTATGGTGGATAGTATVTLTRLDGSALESAREVFVHTNLSANTIGQYVSTVTFATGAAGSVVASGNGWALVRTNASGVCTFVPSDSEDEVVYFTAATAIGGVSSLTYACAVVGSTSDSAEWTGA